MHFDTKQSQNFKNGVIVQLLNASAGAFLNHS